jgi:rSAM/selenodomain-associated transferase 1
MRSPPTSKDFDPPPPETRVVVMAKHPVPGRVKTRLAATLGAEAAAALARAFVLDLAARLAALPYRVTWAYWPAEADFAALVPGARCRPQRGTDLGTRMADAVAYAFAEGTAPVLVLGTDAPHLSAELLAEAAAALVEDDVVLGPADDGGYYLIGLRAPAPVLFTGVEWGTARVLAETLARAREAGLRVHLLPPDFDVDLPADLIRLRERLDRGDVELPHTASLLSTLDSLSGPGGH